MPTPAFAVPYAAPKQLKMMAHAQPIALKNGYTYGQITITGSRNDVQTAYTGLKHVELA